MEKEKIKLTVAAQAAIITNLEYLSYRQAVLYMDKGEDWFCRMMKEFHVEKTPIVGYYKKTDLDRVKRGELIEKKTA